jgi:hypothetical protein
VPPESTFPVRGTPGPRRAARTRVAGGPTHQRRSAQRRAARQ